MRRILPFLAAIMVMLTFWSATAARAADFAPATTEAGVHFAGDRDEVPADQHQSTPHHHAACDAHQIGITAGSVSAGLVLPQEAPVKTLRTAGLPSAEPDAALRPPIA